MKRKFLVIFGLLIALPISPIVVAIVLYLATLFSSWGGAHAAVTYTDRNFPANTCELFARDAWQAADNYRNNIDLNELLNLIDAAPVPDSKKERAFQAIQYVYANRINNPVLAYNLAMGICLEPKKEMAPMNDLWKTSPRTIKDYF